MRSWHRLVQMVLLICLCTTLLFPLPARAQTDDTSVVTFARLGTAEKTMRGPYDAAYLDFSLPMTWDLDGNAELQLNLNTFFARGSTAETATVTPIQNEQQFGGTLQVILNGVTVGNVLLDQGGERTVRVPLTEESLVSPREDGRHLLSLLLDTHEPCGTTQFTTVVVRASSAIVFPHTDVSPPTALANLPRPLYQRTFLTDEAALVLPETPSPAELQAALTIAAGFGRMTDGKLLTDMYTTADLPEDVRSTQHLILVGKAAELGMIQRATLPVALNTEAVMRSGAAPDDGIVQMIVSPWNTEKVMLVASALTDAGVIKAAQALGTGSLMTSDQPNLAVIRAIRPTPPSAVVNVDRTLGDLGYTTQQMYGMGGQYAGFTFDVPVGQVTEGDAYLDLVFVHSALLDYEQSDLMISLNGEPIASARLDDTTTKLGTARLILPDTAIRPGNNQLTVRANLLPRVICSDPRGSGLWLTVRAESLLHLPLRPVEGGIPQQEIDLSRYPSPFTVQPDLSALAFVVNARDSMSRRVAAKIATDLGRQSQSKLVDLVAVPPDSVDDTLRTERDLLLIGHPTDMPLLQELTSTLPISFTAGSNLAADPNALISYRLRETASQGYLALGPAPWNNERSILAVLGSTDEGLLWASNALTDPTLRSKLRGNLSVITGIQIDSRDTRTADVPAPTATESPEEAPTTSTRPGTFLLGAAGILALILVGGLVSALVWWRRRVMRRRLIDGTPPPRE